MTAPRKPCRACGEPVRYPKCPVCGTRNEGRIGSAIGLVAVTVLALVAIGVGDLVDRWKGRKGAGS